VWVLQDGPDQSEWLVISQPTPFPGARGYSAEPALVERTRLHRAGSGRGARAVYHDHLARDSHPEGSVHKREADLYRQFCHPVLVLAVALATSSCAAPTPSPGPAAPTAAAPSALAAPDPYHPAPRDTVPLPLYRGWQQLMLQCARCHGDEAQGTSFAPSLVVALRPDGTIPTRDEFLSVLTNGREDKGMPSAAKMGLDSVYFEGLYLYLKGRSDGRLHGGRPARRED
jgi:mono/diheme cytochrome c family protein